MAKWTDMLLDEELDLHIEDGDFVVGNSIQQDIELILIHNKGAFVATPMVGVGIQMLPNGRITDLHAKLRDIKLQLEADGMTEVSVIQENGENIIYGER
jgi:hypothetical protein